MLISLEWLKEYIDIDASVEQIGEIMSSLGFPVEEVSQTEDGDTVIDFEITSNRGDCLSYIGIARELSVATGKPLKLPKPAVEQFSREAAEFADVNISEPELCNRYTARYIEGVRVGNSPDWMIRRLEASGVRSVNNIVDATNYAMLETGQPPHAFDYEKLAGEKIFVRKANAGETLVSIDHTKCTLKPDMLIIADESGPVAVAGVMGGADTEVSETTTKILLEDAQFDPVSVRSTSRALGLSSEAAFRFERRVDVEMIDFASKRTVQLITMVAGGKVAKGVVDTYPVKAQQPQAVMRLSRLEKLLGYSIEAKTVQKILADLGMQPRLKGDEIVCISPTWRHDITREADLIEEIARVYGYDKIPVNKKIQIEVAKADPRQQCLQKTGQFLNACGYYETLNITFTDEDTSFAFTGNKAKQHLAVSDETRKNTNLLRQTLIGSLVNNIKYNRNVGNSGCRFFEIADTFEFEGTRLNEKTKLALACEDDLRSLRGVLEALIARFDRSSTFELKEADLRWAQVGADVIVNGKKVGVCGKLKDGICKKMGLKDIQPCAAEIEFDVISEIAGKVFKITHLPKFPSVVRDISIIVDEKLKWQQIEQAVREKAPPALENIGFVGLYRGKQIPQGKKSITLTMTFRDEDGTLTHEKVDTYEKPIIEVLSESFGAQLRTA